MVPEDTVVAACRSRGPSSCVVLHALPQQLKYAELLAFSGLKIPSSVYQNGVQSPGVLIHVGFMFETPSLLPARPSEIHCVPGTFHASLVRPTT